MQKQYFIKIKSLLKNIKIVSDFDANIFLVKTLNELNLLESTAKFIIKLF